MKIVSDTAAPFSFLMPWRKIVSCQWKSNEFKTILKKHKTAESVNGFSAVFLNIPYNAGSGT